MRKAFTLVELLVVVSIITLFSSVVFSSVSEARIRAQATRAAGDLRAVENAFQAWAVEDNISTWSILDDGDTLEDLIANNPSLAAYLPEVPDSLAGATWTYDNDGDAYDLYTISDPCPETGVGFVITPASTLDPDFLSYLDSFIDQGSASCGKVSATDGGAINFRIAPDSDSFAFEGWSGGTCSCPTGLASTYTYTRDTTVRTLSNSGSCIWTYGTYSNFVRLTLDTNTCAWRVQEGNGQSGPGMPSEIPPLFWTRSYGSSIIGTYPFYGPDGYGTYSDAQVSL